MVFCEVGDVNSKDIMKASTTIELICIGASASIVPLRQDVALTIWVDPGQVFHVSEKEKVVFSKKLF